MLALIDGKAAVPSRYINKGELATIGGNRAVEALGGFTFQRGVRRVTATENVTPPVIGKLQEATYPRNQCPFPMCIACRQIFCQTTI